MKKDKVQTNNSFNDLVIAIQNAFIEVNSLSEEQHISLLDKYFDEDNNPKIVKIKIPSVDINGENRVKELEVPLLCLVPISSLKLDEIEVDFKVKLLGKVSLSDSETKDNISLNKKEIDSDNLTNLKREYDHPHINNNNSLLRKNRFNEYLGYIPNEIIRYPSRFRKNNNYEGGDNSYASIKLKFRGEDAPEGVLKIKDELIKISF